MLSWLLIGLTTLSQTLGGESGAGGVREMRITVHLVADGNNGIRVDDQAELLRMGDRIKGVTLRSTGQPMCTQFSRGRRKTGSKSCGFLNLQSCPVYTTRDQKCRVLVDCRYLIFRPDRKTGLCDASWIGTVVGASANFVPAPREDVCQSSCDEAGWSTVETRKPIATPAGTALGEADVVIERPY